MRHPGASRSSSFTSANGPSTTSSSSQPSQKVGNTTPVQTNYRAQRELTGEFFHPGLGPNLTPHILLQFLNAKGNILLTLTSGTPASTALVNVLSELNISLPADRTGLVVDHFAYDAVSAPELHDVVLLPPPGPLRPGIADLFGPSGGEDGSLLLAFPRGVGQTLGDGALLTPVVRAPRTAYSYNPKEEALVVEELFAAGPQLSLVSAVQTRNSARFVVVGSAEMLSDKWFDAKVRKPADKKDVATYNREFAKRISGWTFQETGVLRANWVEHHLNEEGAANASNPSIYRIKNDVVCHFFRVPLSSLHCYVGLENLTDVCRRTPSPCPSIPGISGHPLLCRPGTSSSLNSACCPRSTGSSSTLFPPSPPRRQPRTASPSPCRTSMASSTSRSITSGRSCPTSRRRARSPSATWRTMSGRSFVISGAWPWIAGIGVTITGWLAFCALWMFSQPVGKASAVKKTQ